MGWSWVSSFSLCPVSGGFQFVGFLSLLMVALKVNDGIWDLELKSQLVHTPWLMNCYDLLGDLCALYTTVARVSLLSDAGWYRVRESLHSHEPARGSFGCVAVRWKEDDLRASYRDTTTFASGFLGVLVRKKDRGTLPWGWLLTLPSGHFLSSVSLLLCTLCSLSTIVVNSNSKNVRARILDPVKPTECLTLFHLHSGGTGEVEAPGLKPEAHSYCSCQAGSHGSVSTAPAVYRMLALT